MVKWLIFIMMIDNWEGLHSTMFRVGYDIDDCENQLTIVFTKQDSADWTLSENQDRIADSVWIISESITKYL